MTPHEQMIPLVVRFNLHPEADLHPSWLPAEWPARHRTVSGRGPAGREVLADLLRRADEPLFNFGSRLARLALIDAASLRRLAIYTGLCVHQPLMRQRSDAGAQLRRQAGRIDRDAVDFVLDRVPLPDSLRMDNRPMQQGPAATGCMVLARGYRLLLGALAPEGESLLRRVQHKLPRRVCAFSVPQLKPRQLRQLDELMLLCILPDRLPQWDWLF